MAIPIVVLILLLAAPAKAELVPCQGAAVPNRKSVTVQVAKDNPKAWAAKLEPDEKLCRADSRYLDLVVDRLRKEDRRWGYNCKRGNCADPSHDVVAYYYGDDEPYEGEPQVMLVDMISSSCAPDAQPGWLPLDFDPKHAGTGARWTSKGRFKSGPRQDVEFDCHPGSEGGSHVAPAARRHAPPPTAAPESASGQGPGTGAGKAPAGHPGPAESPEAAAHEGASPPVRPPEPEGPGAPEDPEEN